jgi:hypothetical protein
VGALNDAGDIVRGKPVLGRISVHAAEDEGEALARMTLGKVLLCVVVCRDHHMGSVLREAGLRQATSLLLPSLRGVPLGVHVRDVQLDTRACESVPHAGGDRRHPRVFRMIAVDKKNLLARRALRSQAVGNGTQFRAPDLLGNILATAGQQPSENQGSPCTQPPADGSGIGTSHDPSLPGIGDRAEEDPPHPIDRHGRRGS